MGSEFHNLGAKTENERYNEMIQMYVISEPLECHLTMISGDDRAFQPLV